MAEYTREQKLNILKNLPLDLQNLIESEDAGAILLSLGLKYDLTDDKVRLLSKIFGNVALGLLSLTNLSQEINTRVAPDMQTALNLAQDLNIELFFPVMESLKQAPAIANAVLTGQLVPAIAPPIAKSAPVSPAMPVPMSSVKPATPTPVILPSQIPSFTRPDQYREQAETISGPLKPKIGPEPTTALRPIVPPVVTLRPIEKIVGVPTPYTPASVPSPIKVPLPILPTLPTQKIGTPTTSADVEAVSLAPNPVLLPIPAPMPAPMPTPQPTTAPSHRPWQDPAGSGDEAPPQAVVKIPLPTPITPNPLTFTRPAMPTTPAPDAPPAQFSVPKTDTYREPVEFAPLPVPPQLPTQEMAHPEQTQGKQFITSPAEPSIDLEEPASDIIDLRQDRGRF